MRSKGTAFLVLAALILAAVSLHVALGWEWTIVAGFASGYAFRRHGWWLGAFVVGADWLVLVVYNYLVNARATGEMTRAVGTILGNMPSFAIVAITLLIGVLIGLLSGATGMQLRRLVAGKHADDRRSEALP